MINFEIDLKLRCLLHLSTLYCLNRYNNALTLKYSGMKKLLFYLFMTLFLAACEKNKESTSDALNVAGIRSGDSKEVINLRLKSGEITSNTIPCYIFGSSVFDPNTIGFGYVDCYSRFNMIDPQTGVVIYSYQLPGMLNQVVIDTGDNAVIGHYFENDSNYLVKVNLENGALVSKKAIDFGGGLYATTYFFNPIKKEYVLLRADGFLLSIKPETAAIVKSTSVESNIQEACYDTPENRLIGLTYSEATNQNYIEILDVETGDLLSRVEIKVKHAYRGGISGFDPETNCYILVTAENEILFIDIETGEIKDSYQIDFDITEFKFWRSI